MNDMEEFSNGKEMPIPEDAAPTPSGEFYTLMEQMLSGTSLAGADLKDSLGVEFTTDQFNVRIVPHPYEQSSLVIDIAVRQLDPDDAEMDNARLRTIHEINAISRFATGWMAVVDDDDLTLTRTLRLNELDGEILAATISEGIEQAEAFASGWDHLGDLLETLSSQPGEENAWKIADPRQTPGFLRG